MEINGVPNAIERQSARLVRCVQARRTYHHVDTRDMEIDIFRAMRKILPGILCSKISAEESRVASMKMKAMADKYDVIYEDEHDRLFGKFGHMAVISAEHEAKQFTTGVIRDGEEAVHYAENIANEGLGDIERGTRRVTNTLEKDAKSAYSDAEKTGKHVMGDLETGALDAFDEFERVFYEALCMQE